MSLMRSDRQVALNDLHLAMRESADLYESTAGFLQEPGASALCKALAAERLRLAEQLEREIRAEGELPREPDPDKEAAEQLQQRLETLFAESQVAGVISHRLEAERALWAFVQSDELNILEGESARLLADCRQSVRDAQDKLKTFIGEP
ncbi:hypothetical protein [Microbulbifer elongatus]|uniref:hypothetical protein n=1 Tax=Microbulbifer elongatus TaxID=86173 RepID=UPI001CFC490A|nr:hypothetical protein [Microbulbifer elongatus]